MKLQTRIEHIKPDTSSGYRLKLIFHYSSFDKSEMDDVEKSLNALHYGNAVYECRTAYGGQDERG